MLPTSTCSTRGNLTGSDASQPSSRKPIRRSEVAAIVCLMLNIDRKSFYTVIPTRPGLWSGRVCSPFSEMFLKVVFTAFFVDSGAFRH
jgi:hypothetical protein